MKILDSITKTEAFEQITRNPVYIKYNLVIIPLTVLVISLLVIFLVTIPQTYNLLDTYKTIDELNQKVVFYNGKIGGLEQVSEENYQTDLETALIALPADKDIPGSVSQILSIVGSSGLELKNISLGNASSQNGALSNFIIRLEVNGQYDQIKTFLENSKKIARLNKLQSITMNTNLGNRSLAAEIVLQVYFQSLPENIGSIDAPLPVVSEADLKTLEDIKSKVANIRQESPAEEGPKGKFDPFN